MDFLRIFGVVLMFCAVYISAGPAYPTTNFDWDYPVNSPQQQQGIKRRTPLETKQGGRGINDLVRAHISEVDKETQSDWKMVKYMDAEISKILSCYIRLSCPRTRTARTIADCDEIKEWPAYHQIMKMAGIAKYPYQSYSRRVMAESTNVVSGAEGDVIVVDQSGNTAVEEQDDESGDQEDNENQQETNTFQRENFRQRPNHRRFRRGHKRWGNQLNQLI